MDQPTRGILEVARGVLEQLDLDVVLRRVLHAARDLTGARYAALGVLDESGAKVARLVTLGIDGDTRCRIGPLPAGLGVLGELIGQPLPLRLAGVGGHPFSSAFAAGHPPVGSFLGVPVLLGGKPYGNLYLADKRDAVEFSESDEEAVLLLADFAGLAIDHARRFSGSEAKLARLQQTVQALDATIQVARALGGETDLNAILELVAKRGRALVGARALIIELLDGDELQLAAGAGELPEGLIGRRVALANTVASAALRAGETQRLADHRNRARFQQHGCGRLGLRADTGLIVPLVFRDRRYGVLVALDHLGDRDFTDEHQRLLESFAASAATAVATAQSAADERRRQRIAAAEAERGRWARELHDETLQALGNLRLILAGSRRNGDPQALAAAVQQALEQLDLDITTLRALITELRPAALDQLGLEPAVLALVDRARRGGLEVEATVDLAYEQGRASERPVPELETGAYRIVQEALTNASKHAAATHAQVRVVEDDKSIQITVADDGWGFNPNGAHAGFGLAGMHERAELLGGDVSVRSRPGQGTTIRVELPVARRAERLEQAESRPLPSGA